MPRIIGITGLAGAGKSSAASILSIHHGFRLVKFADPIKQMLKVVGLGPAELEGAKKGLPSRLLCGKSPRYAMQTLGTDWGRFTIGDELWVGIWRATAKQMLLDGFPVVCDDVRMANEAAVIRDLGGELWNIKRPSVGRFGATGGLPGHSSESGAAARYATVQLNNSGNLNDLLVAINEQISRN